MGRNQYWAGKVYDMCVYYMTGTPKGSTESGFMEKPGIEPATPGLQGIALIHYTTEASQSSIGQGWPLTFQPRLLILESHQYLKHIFSETTEPIELKFNTRVIQ